MSHAANETSSGSLDSFFLLDYASRYAVDRCGAQQNFWISIMSILAVLPMYAWITIQIITLFRPDIYIILNSMAMNMLTVIQIVLLLLCQGHPPQPGCGPELAFPCAQVTLVAYVVTALLCYRRDFKMSCDNFTACYSTLTTAMLIQWISEASINIGFATNSAVLAACILGCISACTLHEIIIFILNKKPLMLDKLIILISTLTGRKVTCNMLERFEQMDDYRDVYNIKSDTMGLKTPSRIFMGYRQ